MKQHIDDIITYAKASHGTTNHRYDGLPYEHHLRMVATYAKKYGYLLPADQRELAIAGAWCHDLIEDTRQTYNDVKEVCGADVADIVYALTNEKGRTRTERANDKYYEGLKQKHIFVYTKLCDRLAHANYGMINKSSMYNAYRAEHADFISSLMGATTLQLFAPMINELRMLLFPEKVEMSL